MLRGLVVGILGITVMTMPATTAAASAPPAAPPAAPDRQGDFTLAAGDYGVPAPVLLGVSYLESRWDTNRWAPSTSGGYGPMHLTAPVTATVTATAGAGDARGDPARPAPVGATVSPPASGTLAVAAALAGLPPSSLTSDATANIRAGAALLASYQRAVGGPVGSGTDPADWYGAVARYSGAGTDDAAAAFADEVYATIRTGAERTTDDGFHVSLPASATTPRTAWLARAGLRHVPRSGETECPRDVSCEWIPAPYQQNGADPHNYANHDLSERPARQKIEYIVIHDTEATWDTTIGLIQDPVRAASWNYTVRSSDGLIAQHVKAKDVAWQAGNWYVNAKSIGIEHEGFGAEQGAWYTEAMYRSSAKLVRYLAGKYGIPLDRAHILGHDNVPGTVPATVAGMHWDPGPYWDWAHYFDLLHAPFRGWPVNAGLVTFDPDYAHNQPAFTGCDGVAADPCPLHGSTSVVLHTAPSPDAPLLADLGLHPDGSPSTMVVSDHGSRVEAGQTFAVADRSGGWTAIWYLGQKGWFRTSDAKWSAGLVAVPKPGRATIPVYGRAYPEASAYPAGVPYQPITPLQYTFAASQRYAVSLIVPGEYYRATTFDGSSPGDWTVIRGKLRYAQIQFGHRVAYVNLDDVRLIPSVLPS